jgi:hypothetical protein
LESHLSIPTPQSLSQRADEFARATEILRTQATAHNPIWMSSVAKRNIGKDISLLVADIERFESTGQKQDNTWGKRGEKEVNR